MRKKSNKKINLLIEEEPSFKDAKTSEGSMSKLLITQTGYIALISPLEKAARKIHISEINGFEIVTNEKNKLNAGATVAGGLLFGGAGVLIGALGMKKDDITSLYLDFKINDWDNTSLRFYLLNTKTKSNGFIAKTMIQSAEQICSLLEHLESQHKEKVNV